ANVREVLREAEADVAEGADALIVKPGLPYLDVIRAVRDRVQVPVCAYQVSGEYAMLHAAAERGWLDLERSMWETTLGLRRPASGRPEGGNTSTGSAPGVRRSSATRIRASSPRFSAPPGAACSSASPLPTR